MPLGGEHFPFRGKWGAATPTTVPSIQLRDGLGFVIPRQRLPVHGSAVFGVMKPWIFHFQAELLACDQRCIPLVRNSYPTNSRFQPSSGAEGGNYLRNTCKRLVRIRGKYGVRADTSLFISYHPLWNSKVRDLTSNIPNFQLLRSQRVFQCQSL